MNGFLRLRAGGDHIVVTDVDGESRRVPQTDARVISTERPIPIGAGDRIQTDGLLNELSAALVLMQPTEDLHADLEDRAHSSGYIDEQIAERPPLDAGNTVDDEAWGWIRGPERWHLVPVMFVADAVELSRAAAGLTTSMTGVLISGTVHYTPQAALLLQKEDWQLKAMSVTYGLDPAAVAPLAFDAVFGELDPLCPCDEHGWEITLSADAALAPTAVADARAAIWQPCKDHPDCVLVEDVARFTWTGARWIPS